MSVVAAAAEKQMKTTAKPPPLKRSRLLKRPRRAPQKKNLNGVAIVTTLQPARVRNISSNAENNPNTNPNPNIYTATYV